MKLFKKNKFAKISIFSLSFLFGFSTILTGCQTWTQTTKNFSNTKSEHILGEDNLTSLPSTPGISPKYDLDGDDKNGTWALTSNKNIGSFTFSSERKISWTELAKGTYNLTLSWESADKTTTLTKTITLTVADSGGSTPSPTPSGKELTASGNVPWDGFYREQDNSTYNYCPNFLSPSNFYPNNLSTLNNWKIDDFIGTTPQFLLLTTNPNLMRFSDNGNEYYHKRIFVSADPRLIHEWDATKISTIDFEIAPVPGADVKSWYHIYLTKDEGYTRREIFENGTWDEKYVDTDTGFLTINDFFDDPCIVRDVTTVGVCKDSPFNPNNPVPSNNLFSFIRPFRGESCTYSLTVNGVKIKNNDTNYSIKNYKFGIKKSSILVGYKYNFLFNITYGNTTYYKVITIEGSELYKVDGYQNDTNYYIDIDKVENKCVDINPANSQIYMANDVTFDLTPSNSQATLESNLFSLAYKTADGKTVGEISWHDLSNNTGNNKIWVFEFKIKVPFSSKIFKIIFNFFLLPISFVTSDKNLIDGKEANGTQFINLNVRASSVSVSNKTFTVSSSIPGIKLISALTGGTENKTDSSGRIYLKGKTDLQNESNVSYIITIAINNFTLNIPYTIQPGNQCTLDVNDKIYKMSNIVYNGNNKSQIEGWSDDFISVLSKTDSEIQAYIRGNGTPGYEFGDYLKVNLSDKFIAWNANFTNALVWSKLNINILDFRDSNWIVWSSDSKNFYSGYQSFKGVTSNSLKEINLENACFFSAVKMINNGKLSIEAENEWNAYMNPKWTSGKDERSREQITEYHTAYHTFEGCNFKNLKTLNLEKTNFFLKDFSITEPKAWNIILNDSDTARYSFGSGTKIKIFGASATFINTTFGNEETPTKFNFKNMKFFSGHNDENVEAVFDIINNYSKYPDINYLNIEVTSGNQMFYGSTIYAEDLTFEDINFYPYIKFTPHTTLAYEFDFGINGANIGSEMFKTTKIHAAKILFKNCVFARIYTADNNLTPLTIKILDRGFASSTLYGVCEINIDNTNHFTTTQSQWFKLYNKTTLSLFEYAFADIDNKGKTQKISIDCVLNIKLDKAASPESNIGIPMIVGRPTVGIFQHTFENFVPNTECHILIGWDASQSNITMNMSEYFPLLFFDGAFAGFGGTENYVKVYGKFNLGIALLLEDNENWNLGFVCVKSVDLSKMIFADSNFGNQTIVYENLFLNINSGFNSKTGTYIYLPTQDTTPEQKFDSFVIANSFGRNYDNVCVFVGYSSEPIWFTDAYYYWQYYPYSIWQQ